MLSYLDVILSQFKEKWEYVISVFTDGSKTETAPGTHLFCEDFDISESFTNLNIILQMKTYFKVVKTLKSNTLNNWPW